MLDVPISCEGIMHVYPRVPRVVIRTGRIQVASRVAYWVCDVCCESAGTIVILVCVSCSEHATSLERDNRNRTGIGRGGAGARAAAGVVPGGKRSVPLGGFVPGEDRFAWPRPIRSAYRNTRNCRTQRPRCTWRCSVGCTPHIHTAPRYKIVQTRRGAGAPGDRTGTSKAVLVGAWHAQRSDRRERQRLETRRHCVRGRQSGCFPDRAP